MSDTYRPAPACPRCGKLAPPDWDDAISHDYYWRGWENGETEMVRCRACDRWYRIETRVDVTFRSYLTEDLK